jgi:hypothetical protein
MPDPPEGEAELRRLASRFERIDAQIRELVARAPTGDRRRLLSAALAMLVALRQLDLRRPVTRAYLVAFTEVGNGGELREPRDLANSLHLKLDRGAQTASQSVTEALRRATTDNLDQTTQQAVIAYTDARNTSWTLGRWARLNCDTIGRQATSRGFAHGIGEGGRFTVHIGECGLCYSLFGGGGVVGEDPMPPGHPGCTCVATTA